MIKKGMSETSAIFTVKNVEGLTDNEMIDGDRGANKEKVEGK